MRVSLQPEALDSLQDTADFIDTINTEGSGKFWITNFIHNLYSYAKPNVQYALCKHPEFAKEGLSCITFNGWVIAFKIEGDVFLVYSIIRGSLLQ